MRARTSSDFPIRVDFIKSGAFPILGQLGMTFAPGKKQLNPVSGPAWDRDLGIDLERMREHYGIEVLVSLVEDGELDELCIAELVGKANEADIRTIRFPIRDMSVPKNPESFSSMVDQVVGKLREKKKIAVHCKGGLGRAGTVAACISIAASNWELAGGDAIKLVRTARPGTVENSLQESFVRSFADRDRFHIPL
jgi:protein-tyrosine phosphatase